MPRIFLPAVVWLLFGSPADLLAQVRWDDVSKVYMVTVHDDSGNVREMRVEPTNRVIPVFRTTQDTGTRTVYRYHLSAHATSPQSLAMVRIPCPAAAAIEDREGGDWNSRRFWGTQLYCSFLIGRVAGDSLRTVRFSSTWLGGLGRAVAVGGSEPPLWPTSEPTGETIALMPVVDSLTGAVPNGLVKTFPLPVPMFERRVIIVTASGLAILSQQLTAICAETDWIQRGPTCADLASQLAPATAAGGSSIRANVQTAALTASERNAVRQALNTFLDSLSAGRDVTIHQNAFTVLSVLARTVRSGLTP